MNAHVRSSLCVTLYRMSVCALCFFLALQCVGLSRYNVLACRGTMSWFAVVLSFGLSRYNVLVCHGTMCWPVVVQ